MFEEFGVIKKDSKIAIYGAGSVGAEIKKFLEANRPDIKILFFVDAKKTGEYEGLEVFSLKELPEKKDLFDILIISARGLAPEMMVVLNYFDVPFLLISRPSEWSSKLIPYAERQKQTLSIFKTDEDRFVYNMLWEAYCTGFYEKIEQYVYKKYNISKYQPLRNYNVHYMEYINKDAIKTIVDGGFCNGINSLAFKKYMKNLKRIFAFEPMYEKFRDENYDYFLKQGDFVEVIPLGLWNETCEIEFCENIPFKGASRILGTKGVNEKKPHENIVKIQTTTIDEAKQNFGIEKIDLIKLDVEGAESQVLQGAEKSIAEDRPQLAVSIYHSVEDFVSIPLYLNKVLENYIFRVGHYSYDINETVLYAIPNELLT